MDWIGLDLGNWTHVQLCVIPLQANSHEQRRSHWAVKLASQTSLSWPKCTISQKLYSVKLSVACSPSRGIHATCNLTLAVNAHVRLLGLWNIFVAKGLIQGSRMMPSSTGSTPDVRVWSMGNDTRCTSSIDGDQCQMCQFNRRRTTLDVRLRLTGKDAVRVSLLDGDQHWTWVWSMGIDARLASSVDVWGYSLLGIKAQFCSQMVNLVNGIAWETIALNPLTARKLLRVRSLNVETMNIQFQSCIEIKLTSGYYWMSITFLRYLMVTASLD